MSLKILKLFTIASLMVSAIFICRHSAACGHEGMYAGVGYTQLFMYTSEKQNNPFTSDKVTFGPGYGGNAMLGYDFRGSRWGIQVPFEMNRLKLNRNEWVNFIGLSAEGVFHIIEWKNGIDFHLVGGAGWAYLSDGSVNDGSQSAGIMASLGPGLSYYFTRTEKISGAVTFEVPFRFIHFFKDRISVGGTSIAAFPIRLTMQIGF